MMGEETSAKRKKLFGTAGIRGLTNIEITPSLALGIGGAFGKFLMGDYPENADRVEREDIKVFVGRDTRYGAKMLEHAVVSGLLSSGIDVAECGVLPTPALTWLVKECEKDVKGGVMVTGSHTPEDRIGIILILGDGTTVFGKEGEVIENIYYEIYGERRPEKGAPYNEIKTPTKITDALNRYRKMLLSTIDERDVETIKRKEFKVLVDPCNGTAAGFLGNLLEEIGCTVVRINDAPSPEFGRPSEPRAETLTEAARITKEEGCDIGIGTDVDADRVLFIDERGNVASEDAVGALFAKNQLRNGDVCVVPINSSGLIEIICEEEGAKLVQCRVGPPEITDAIIKNRACFGYEESGKYFFARQFVWADGIFASLNLLNIMAESNMTLSELLSRFPRFYQVKKGIKCDDSVKTGVMDEIRESDKLDTLGELKETVTIDGVKKVYGDNSWLLVRASGTEPLIRVFSDAMSRERAEELVEEGCGIVTEIIANKKIEI